MNIYLAPPIVSLAPPIVSLAPPIVSLAPPSHFSFSLPLSFSVSPQILEDVCTKTNNWGSPLYSLYSMSTSAEGQQLYQYKVGWLVGRLVGQLVGQ